MAGKLHSLQTNKAADRSEDVVFYLNLTTHLKALNIAHLFGKAIVLFNLQVLVVQRLKV